MASGTSAPGVMSLEEVGTADLDGVSLPDPTDPAWTLAGLLSELTFGTLADPRPHAFAMVAIRPRSYDSVFLDHIHIIPRERDLGAVVSEQEILIEVFNAYMQRSQIMDEITVTGPQGIEVDDDLGQPAHFAASNSHLYTVVVSAEGDPQIDNLVTWIFLGIDPLGTGLALVGFRMIPFPFQPNMGQEVLESFGYLTDIIESHTGMEQRIQLRELPVGTITYNALLTASRDAQMAQAILFGNQARTFGVGRWQFRGPLAEDVELDDVQIFCETDDVPFEVGGLFMLWRDPYTWEVHTIEAVESDHIVSTTGMRSAWSSVITTVVPMVIGRLSPDEASSWESLQVLSQTPRFLIEGFRP